MFAADDGDFVANEFVEAGRIGRAPDRKAGH